MSDHEAVLLHGTESGQLTAVREGGQVLNNGELWRLAGDAGQIAEIMRANRVPRNADRPRVLRELQLVGYWPAKDALRDYMEGCK